jgi:hypothetical protein
MAQADEEWISVLIGTTCSIQQVNEPLDTDRCADSLGTYVLCGDSPGTGGRSKHAYPWPPPLSLYDFNLSGLSLYDVNLLGKII